MSLRPANGNNRRYSEERLTALPAGIEVGIEANTASVGGLQVHLGRVPGVVVREVHICQTHVKDMRESPGERKTKERRGGRAVTKVEEAAFVGCAFGPYDERADVRYVVGIRMDVARTTSGGPANERC
jgi:hypothetical protein